MVVRQFARAMFDYAFNKIVNPDATTIYDEDTHRLGAEDGDQSLRQCQREINENLATAKTSTYAMVKVSHFKTMDKLSTRKIILLQDEWRAADQILSEMEIEDKHVLHPDTLFEDFPISSNVQKALGIRQSSIDIALLREAREKPKGDGTNTTPPDKPPTASAAGGAGKSESNAKKTDIAPGELADVASQSNSGTRGMIPGDSARGPQKFDISDKAKPKPKATPLKCGKCDWLCPSRTHCKCTATPQARQRNASCKVCKGAAPPTVPKTDIEPPAPKPQGPHQGDSMTVHGMSFTWESDVGWLTDVSECEGDSEDEPSSSDNEDADESSGAARGQNSCSNLTPFVKTIGGPKSNDPIVYGSNRSVAAGGEDEDNVDLEGGQLKKLPSQVKVPEPSMLRKAASAGKTALLGVFPTGTDKPLVLNISSSLKAAANHTSRDPPPTGKRGGVGQLLARTNPLCREELSEERRTNSAFATQVDEQLEPHLLSKTPTSLVDPCFGEPPADAIRTLTTPIVGAGSQPQRAERAVKRERRGKKVQASLQPKPTATMGKTCTRWQPVRRGTNNKSQYSDGAGTP
jgi:hypothetical protein